MNKCTCSEYQLEQVGCDCGYEQQAHIDRLFSMIKGNTVPMAVVDYLGKVHAGFELVTEDSPLDVRFGVRDMRHVALYDLTTIRLNKAATD